MRLKETYESRNIHAGWEAAYRGNPLQDRFNSRMLDRLIAKIAPVPGGLALDAGCGVGYHSLALAQRGFQVVGVDISNHILEQARANASQLAPDAQISFRCDTLEELGDDEGTYDLVHCRGVLMHIPEWENALAQLCRVLKPGGSILVIEGNTSALETRLVRLIRRFRSNRSELVSTPGGLEFWANQDGKPMVTRIANVGYLRQKLTDFGLTVSRRIGTEFWDILRFPSGAIRNSAIYFNRFWFEFGLLPSLSMGNALIGRKRQ